MTNTVVEIHVPLRAGPRLAVTDYAFPWIEMIEDFLTEVEEQGQAEVFDEGEEFGGVYIFFISGAEEDQLLRVASRVAALDAAPDGVFAMVSDDEAESLGMGRRVDLPWPPK